LKKLSKNDFTLFKKLLEGQSLLSEDMELQIHNKLEKEDIVHKIKYFLSAKKSK